ncbi:hypothetical protein LTR74_012145 [Friedmanniomyces endolithicus]|nr:hypothetical protein LTR74_012145 [Friedmanniomyces endolithicus]
MDGETPTDQRSGLRDNEDDTSRSVGPMGSTAPCSSRARGSAERGRADEDVKQALGDAAGEIPPPYPSSAAGGEGGIAAGERRGEGGETVGPGVGPPLPQSAAVFSTGHYVDVLGKKDAKIRELETHVQKQRAEEALLRDRLVDRGQLDEKVKQLEAVNENLRKEQEQLRVAMEMVRVLGALLR